MTITQLFGIITLKKNLRQENSYISSLFSQGVDRIIQKVGEEAVELVIAAKNQSKERVISEAADLVFHSLVLFSALGISPNEIMQELELRNVKRNDTIQQE
ncbi:MAG: phosphoribosyl-ATP diphosphatase [Candidatus Woesebacteria bacterium]